jgi:hypothetical protein
MFSYHGAVFSQTDEI